MICTTTKKTVALSFSCAICLLTLTFATSASAPSDSAVENDSASIEEVVSVETRLNDDQFGIGEQVSVSHSELTNNNPVDAEQMLQTLPGFSVSRPGGPGGVSEIFLRGAESNFTAVYVDGVRLNDPSNTRGGSFDFSSLDTFGINRIDVSAGAMSAVYGADAMAGVILIRTNWAEPGSPVAFFEAGSVNNWRAGAQASFEVNDDTQWGIRVSSTDGGDEINGSSLRMDSVGTRLAGSFSGSGSWEINLRHATRDRSSFPEVSGGPQLAVNEDLETSYGEQLTIAGTGSWNVTDSWRSDLYVSSSAIEDDIAVPAVAPGLLDGQPAFSSDTRYEREQLLWVNHVAITADSNLVAGVDFVAEDGSDEGTVDLGFAVVPNSYQLNRTTSSAFAEFGKRWNEHLTTTVSTRWDRSDSEGRFSGKLGLTRTVSASDSRVWVSIANGFKLPGFFALGNPLFGNPDLISEKVRSAEVGYTHEFSATNQLIVTAFKSRYENLVDFDFESFTNINRGRTDVSGVEIRSDLMVSDNLRLLIDATFSNISSASGPLRRRPERTGGIGLNWAASAQWNLNATARYASPRLITSIPTGDMDVSGFALVRVTARFSWLPNRSLWIAIDNALDEEYQDAPGFPSPGAQVRFGANVAF